MKRIQIISILCSLFSLSAFAQTSEEEVRKTIDQMFDGMRKGDSTMVHEVFADEVKMQTIVKSQNGQTELRTSSLSNFLNAVGTPHDEVWDEKLLSYEILIDGDMASVWTPYQFYRGENFSHCGVNSFQLAKLQGNWKIIYLVDTRKREGCL